MSDRKGRRGDSLHNVDYGLTHRFFSKLADFLLYREMYEISEYITLCVEHIQPSDETADFFDAIVSSEDGNPRYEQFWAIWKGILPKYIETSRSSTGYHFGKMTHRYLLAWPYWKPGIEEWHSLKEPEVGLCKEIAEQAGGHPAVLDSISQVLNGIGSHFVDSGILWLYTITAKNKNLETEALETNTVYYLEKISRKYIYLNRYKIKRDSILRSKIINILDFMVTKGSVQGYLLREDIV
jgi:hypothetical protein